MGQVVSTSSWCLAWKNDEWALDLCYNIRHFERHGRELEDLWSCRQSTIHQKYSFDTKQSSWVVIQPPILFASSLKCTRPTNTAHPMGLHLRYLAAATARWREYLNDIADRLKVFVSQPESLDCSYCSSATDNGANGVCGE